MRPHVVTGGRAHPSHGALDHATLIRVVRGGSVDLGPEQRRLVKLCRGGPLSVAEIAAYLALPVSVIKVLLSDLIEYGNIIAHEPILRPSAQQPHLQILEEVLNGLRSRL